MSSKEKRTSNFELLRIIAIILIVMQHFAYYSNFNHNLMPFWDNTYVFMVEIFGKLGVFLFVIITGYFYEKNRTNIKKYIFLEVKILIYSLLCLVFGSIINSDKMNIGNIIKSFFPCCFGLYWFATCYLLLIIFAPYLNIIIEKLDKISYRKFLIVLFSIISIIAYIPKTEVYFNNLFMFIFIYFIGAYIKKYEVNIKSNVLQVMLMFLLIFALVIVVLFMAMSYKIDILNKYLMFPFYLNSPLTVFLGITIFLMFKNLKIKSEVINAISRNTFGIYLIHENLFVRDTIWNYFWNLSKYTGIKLIIGSIVKIFIIIVGCVIISYLIDNVLIKNVNVIIEKILSRIKLMYDKCERKYIQDGKKVIDNQ